MKNFTKELKNILKEDPGAPIMSPDQILSRTNTMVILTNDAPRELLALAGPTRKAILLNYKPLMITFPNQRGVYKVEPDDIVFENHHTGRDVTEAGSEETDYEKFFAQAMKKFGVSSPIELSPEDTKKFFNYVDKNWDAEEESDGSKDEVGWDDPPRLGDEPSLITPNEDVSTGKVSKKNRGSKNEILPAIGAALGGVARGAMALGGAAARGAATAAGASLAPDFGDDENEDVSTGKVGKKDKGSYQHAYKLALKKYQIHSADELDTPAERKGFTAYVDRLWKGGEVHRDKKEVAIGEDEADDRRKEQEREQKKREKERERKSKKKEQKKKEFKQWKKSKKKTSAGGSKSLFKGKGIGGALGKIGTAAKSQASKYQTKEASAATTEVSPPDRKHQVKGIKKHMAQKKGEDKIPKTYVDKKTGKRKKTNPWALAWAQYDKYGVPSRIEKD